MLKLSVLEQAPISKGLSPRETLKNTVVLAKLVEKLSYRRIWFAEHHNTRGLASSSPELMIAHVAAQTERIHVGSGGVLLTHYSPYKVAENFRLLENMYPGRIDLGIGRAPGGVPLTSLALADGDRRGSRDFPRKVRDLISYLTDSLSPEHPYAGVQATPVSENVPGIYLLGSSDGSATLAADMGTPFMFAHFINPHGGEAVTRQYRLRYQPSALYPEPSAAVCIFVVCAETDEEAERQASTLRYWMLKIAEGQSGEIPTIEEAAAFVPTEWEHRKMMEDRGRLIVGNPQKVKRALEQLAAAYQTDEVMIITNIHDFSAKCRSFELIAKAFQESE